ncbi:MAG: DUF3549 family protein [Pseudomonadota bacterium]
MTDTTLPGGLSDLCRQNAITLHPFDMGRQIRAFEAETFAALEAGHGTYPWPFQRKARLALVGEGTDAEPFVWFLDLPLDEAGHLHPAVRDDLLARLAESHARSRQDDDMADDALSDPLKDSAYGFTPDQERMAALHARAALTLGHPPSAYYEHARLYLDGEHGWEQWAFLGVQGLADIAARIREDGNTERVAAAIPHLPETPFTALARQLEHTTVPEPVATAILERVHAADAEAAAMGLRALSAAEEPAPRRAWLHERLADVDPETDVPLLAALAARAWEDLAEPAIAAPFLEALAHGPGGREGFVNTVRELLALEALRAHLHPVLVDDQRGEAVREAVGELFGFSS